MKADAQHAVEAIDATVTAFRDTVDTSPLISISTRRRQLVAHRKMKLDSLVGMGMLLVATAVFTYYTAWTFLVPFIDESSPMARVFPPREWIIRIPALLLVLGTGVVGTFIGWILIKPGRKQSTQSAVKKTQ